ASGDRRRWTGDVSHGAGPACASLPRWRKGRGWWCAHEIAGGGADGRHRLAGSPTQRRGHTTTQTSSIEEEGVRDGGGETESPPALSLAARATPGELGRRAGGVGEAGAGLAGDVDL